jgi:hypothetical protein
MTFVKIIEALVHEFETPGKMNRSAYAPRSGVHFRDYQNICIVDRSTFYRRVRKGMDPISAATQPALPTRPYDKERRK